MSSNTITTVGFYEDDTEQESIHIAELLNLDFVKSNDISIKDIHVPIKFRDLIDINYSSDESMPKLSIKKENQDKIIDLIIPSLDDISNEEIYSIDDVEMANDLYKSRRTMLSYNYESELIESK